MRTVKYIIYCIIDCFDAAVGKSTSGGIKEGLVGLASILSIVLMFFAIFFLISKKTSLDYRTNILCSLIATVLFVFVIFILLIIVEKILF